MALEESAVEQPEEQIAAQANGPGPKPAAWVTKFQSYVTKKPDASDEDLYKQFPELGKDSKRLDGAFSYVHAKSQGMTDEESRKLYPDLVGPAEPYIDPKYKSDISDKVQEKKAAAPAATPAAAGQKFQPVDMAEYEKKVLQPTASESTAGGSTAIKQGIQAQENSDNYNKKIQAKYKPMVDKVMADIDEHRDHFVTNHRPALDFHPDAPDNYYDAPNMTVIDDYLKKTIPDPKDRYYVRNRVLNDFQANRDAYTTGVIADKKIEQLPAIQQAQKELTTADNFAKPKDQKAILARAQEIDPTIHDKINAAYREASVKNDEIKNEHIRMILNNSTSLQFDQNGQLKKVNTLDVDAPFHDEITGSGKALQGFLKFAGSAGQMSSGLLNFFGAKETGYNLQKSADDFIAKNAFPGGKPELGEYLAGDLEPMVLQGEAMGRLAHGIGAPAFKALAGASAKGLISKFAEGALGGVALAPINSALMSHDYYTQLVRNGEAPEIAHAKAQNVFNKNLVTDMAISPVQFGIMNAPVNNLILKAVLRYAVSPAIAGGHFMAQDYFQQKENNPALTVWKYATSPEGIKTGITGAVMGLVQHAVISKMNDWQNEKNVKDAFSYGRKDGTPATADLPNKTVLANTVLNAFEMKDTPRRADELKGLVTELAGKGVYNEQEAATLHDVIDDVAAVKGQVPKMGTSPQRMAVFNELLNKRSYESKITDAGNMAVREMLEGKMKESDQRIQKIMNEEEPLYFINGNETSKEQLLKWASENPDLVKSKAANIDIINDEETKNAIYEAKNKPTESAQSEPGSKEAQAGEEVSAAAPTEGGKEPEPQPVIPPPAEEPADGSLVDGEEPPPVKPVIPGRSQDFSDFYHNFKGEIGNVTESSWDYRLDIPMDQKTREGAVKDIEAGKKSKRAQTFLDELDKMHSSGMIDFTRGRGNHVEKFGIPVEEWNTLQEKAEPQVVHDIESGAVPDHILSKWLEEEAANFHDDGTEKGQTGHATGEGDADTSEGKLLQTVRKVDEGEAGDRPTASKHEPHAADKRAEGSVRAPGVTESGGHLPAASSKNVEEHHAVNELAARLGRKVDKITGAPVLVGGKEHSTEQYLTKSKAVLNQLFPDHEIKAYDTEAEYTKAEKRPTGSAGVYDSKGKYIAFNMERIRAAGAENTIFHEVIHPIVHEALQSRPGAVDSAYSKLVGLKDVPGMEKVWAHEEHYRGRGVETMKVEAITEFLTHVADGKIDVKSFPVSTRTKIIDTINKVFKALGIRKVISTAQDIGRLADNIKTAFTNADAAPIKESLGKRDAGGSSKMDSIKPGDKTGPAKDKDELASKYARKAYTILNELFPDHNMIVYHSEKEYVDEGHPEKTGGAYYAKSKRIVLNQERIKDTDFFHAAFHEVIHPIVREAMQLRPGAIDAAYSKLLDIKDVNGMDKIWSHMQHYKERGPDIMKLEAITEFLARVADGQIDATKLTPTLRTKFVDVVNRLFRALGIKKVISTAQDIARLSDRLKTAFDNDDATQLRQAMGKSPQGSTATSQEKYHSIVEDEPGKDEKSLIEQFVREKINEYKEPSLIKALTNAGRMSEEDAKKIISDVRAEQNMSPEEIIKQAMEFAKAKKAGTLPGTQISAQILEPVQATNMKPGLMKTLKRWYFDGKDQVSDVKSIIRKNKGQEEFEIDKIYHATRKLIKEWNFVPKVKQMAFMLGVEKPELLAGQSEKNKEIAAGYRARLDKTFETIGKVMPDLNYIEDYFPHFWEKPEQARNFFANTLAKAPLEGGKSFAKKRFFETIVSGLKEGYKLSTTNPEEMVRLAEANAWKFKTAHDIFGDMKKAGYLKYAMGKDRPEGWETVQDPLFTKMAAALDKNGNPDLVQGAFYMPPDVAKLVNEYLPPGIKGPVKDFVQQYNNVKNLFQLGVGFFHFGTTSLDSMVSGVTNGIQKLSAGNLKGIVDLATLGNLPATVIRGFKAKSDWNNGKLTADVQSLIDANAKVGRQKMYALDTKYNMMKAFGQLRADGDFKQLPKALWNAMLFLPEAINKPLMEHWVPALKVGGYLRSLDSEISSRKNMTPAELQTAKQKIWDSMDDRLGQVVYDNIFMKKTYKDLAFMAIRSAGWTGGTIRAVSGGLAELPRSAQRVVRGQGMSQRTAYLAALPLTVGVLGGFLHYLMTGTPPDELKDYFFPKDGTKSADGTDHRLVLPSYMKDILAYREKPLTTLLHKTSPLLNDIVELYNNKDFYGERVYNKEDPMYQKGFDILKHEAETMEPFSFRTDPNAPEQTKAQWALQKFGITNAPREREKSDIQNKISNAFSDQIGKEMDGKTHAEMEQQIARKHIRNLIFAGSDYKDIPDEMKEKAAIAPHSLGKFIHDSQMDPYERYFKQLKSETKIKLYREMSDEDKAKYGHWIKVSDREAANKPAEKTEE